MKIERFYQDISSFNIELITSLFKMRFEQPQSIIKVSDLLKHAKTTQRTPAAKCGKLHVNFC